MRPLRKKKKKKKEKKEERETWILSEQLVCVLLTLHDHCVRNI